MRFSFASSRQRCMALFVTTAYLFTTQVDLAASIESGSLKGYVASPFSIPIDVDSVHLIDLNADKRQDLILEFSDELRVVHQDADGFEVSNYQSIPIPQQFATWDVASIDSNEERLSILVVDSDSNLTLWQQSGSLYQPTVVEIPVPSLHLPKNTIRSRFCIDINGDSIDDLALPSTHFLHLLEISEGKQLLNSSKIRLLSSSRASLSNEDLMGTIGQTYRASPAVFRDIDNDSYTDVVLQNDSAVRIGLGNASETSYFSSIPDYDIKFEKDSRKISFDSIDFSNLFSLIRFAPNRVQIKDVNQDQMVDLTILEPNRVLTYIADESGIDTSKPTQVMRFNQNTFIVEILDVNEDGNLDLVAVKTPVDVSVRKVLLAFVVPTNLRFELLVFEHANGAYSRRPDSRLLVNIKVPALLPTLVKYGDMSDGPNNVEASVRLGLFDSNDEPPVPILDAQLDEGRARDVIAIQSGEVRVFFNTIEGDYMLEQRSQVEEIRNLLKTGREITFDFGKALATEMQTTALIDMVSDTEPVVVHRLESDQEFHDLMRFQLNDDELDDIMVFEDRTNKAITGVVLLSQDQ